MQSRRDSVRYCTVEVGFDLEEDNVHRLKTPSLVNCASSSDSIADSFSSNVQLKFLAFPCPSRFHIYHFLHLSTFFLFLHRAMHMPSIRSFHPSFHLFFSSIPPPINPPIHPPIHKSIHPSIHSSIHPPIHPNWAYGRLSHARGPLLN